MENKQIGFYVMLASMLLGLFALKIGVFQFKEKKDKFLSILTSLAGTALVLVGYLVRMAKINRETSVKPRFFILFENQIQTTSASPCRTQVQPAAIFLVCSLIFIEYQMNFLVVAKKYATLLI